MTLRSSLGSLGRSSSSQLVASSRSMAASARSTSARSISRSSPVGLGRASRGRVGEVVGRPASSRLARRRSARARVWRRAGRRVAGLVGEQRRVGEARLEVGELLLEVGQAVEHRSRLAAGDRRGHDGSSALPARDRPQAAGSARSARMSGGCQPQRRHVAPCRAGRSTSAGALRGRAVRSASADRGGRRRHRASRPGRWPQRRRDRAAGAWSASMADRASRRGRHQVEDDARPSTRPPPGRRRRPRRARRRSSAPVDALGRAGFGDGAP